MSSSEMDDIDFESNEICHQITNEKGDTPLHLAARANRADVVKRLLDAGADVNALNYCGNAPLHAAINKNAESAVLVILHDPAADVDIRTRAGLTPLMLTAQCASSPCIIEDLLAAGADVHATDNTWKTALHWAAKEGREVMIDLLLRHGASVTVGDDQGDTPLHLSSWSKNGANVAKRLLAADADPNARGKCGHTPMHTAVFYTSLPVFRVLLQHQADVNARAHCGSTPLMYVSYWKCESESRQIFAELINAGADIHAADENGSTMLHKAAEDSYVRLPDYDLEYFFKYLLDLGADVNAQNNEGFTPLHLAVKYGDANFVRILLNHPRIDVNLSTTQGKTPLHLAAFLGKKFIAADLIASGADVTAVDENGMTPLHFTAQNHGEFFSYDIGPKTTECDFNVHIADIARRLLDAGADVNAKDNDGNTPIHLAVKTPLMLMAESSHDAGTFKELINAGGDVHARDNDGRTVMHRVAMNARFDFVDVLLELGLTVDVRDYQGRTPLYLVAQAGGVPECETLLAMYFADRDIADHAGKRPRDAATEADQLHMLPLLNRYMPAG